MSSVAPVIQYLRLDENNDLIFDPTFTLTNLEAVSQAVLTRLNLFLGEWWEDLSIGLPVFQSMLGQLGSTQTVKAMQLAVQQNIAGAPFVTAVSSVQVSFEDGQFKFTAVVSTIFGTVNVSSSPGLQASLGGPA